jgi:protein-arginine kinase activator protein McsA
MKVCARCKEEKDTTEYRKDKNKTDGLFHTCKTCMDKYYVENKDKYAQRGKVRRKLWKDVIDTIKKDLKCSNCPENHISALDFHHTDPSKKDFNITTIRYKSFTPSNVKILNDEISKCIILCANCHRKYHWDEK